MWCHIRGTRSDGVCRWFAPDELDRTYRALPSHRSHQRRTACLRPREDRHIKDAILDDGWPHFQKKKGPGAAMSRRALHIACAAEPPPSKSNAPTTSASRSTPEISTFRSELPAVSIAFTMILNASLPDRSSAMVSWET